LQKKEAASARIASLGEDLKAAVARESEIEGELFGLKGERGGILERTLALQREIDVARREGDRIEARRSATAAARESAASKVEALRSQIEGCGVDPSQEPPSSESVAEKIMALEQAMRALEPVNMLAIAEYDHVKTRYDILAPAEEHPRRRERGYNRQAGEVRSDEEGGVPLQLHRDQQELQGHIPGAVQRRGRPDTGEP